MELLTIDEAALVLRISPVTVRRHVRAGSLAAVRVGRNIRIDRDEIERFVSPVVPEAAKSSPPVGAGKVLTADSPFWELVGIMEHGPADLSTNHDKYLAEAYADEHDE